MAGEASAASMAVTAALAALWLQVAAVAVEAAVVSRHLELLSQLWLL